MAGRRRWSEDERRAVLAAHEDSGLSLWAFARAAEIPYTTLVHWRSRGEAEGAPRLVPVEVASDGGGDGGDVVVELAARGVVVRVREDADEALLTRVVRALRAC